MNELYPWQHTIWQRVRGTVAVKTHAVLLKGRKGIGKLDFARSLAKSLLCEQVTTDWLACGICASCKWFEQGSHPNFYLMKPEAITDLSGEAGLERGRTHQPQADTAKTHKKTSQHITIEQVRALNDFVYLSGHQEGFKIILIHPAEAMNAAAANALLKKLEEPPSRILFILVAHRVQHLLPTIRSRCQQIAMPVPDAASACHWLTQQGVKHPDTYLALAGYSPLQAIAFNQSDYFNQYADFIRHISTPASLDPISLANKLHKLDLPDIVSWLQKWCYDLISFHTTGNIRYHLQQEMAIKKLAAAADLRLLVSFWRNLSMTQQLSSHPLNTKLFLEEMLLSYLRVMVPKRHPV